MCGGALLSRSPSPAQPLALTFDGLGFADQ
jgi:hypothetical protein